MRQWASVSMGVQAPGGGGTNTPAKGRATPRFQRRTGVQVRKVYVFPGLYPQLYPRFALDAGALWRTSTDSKSLIYQRKRAFAGCWRTPGLADIESPYVKSQKFRKVPTKIPTKRKVSPPTSANCGQFNAANTSASAGAGLGLARRCPNLGALHSSGLRGQGQERQRIHFPLRRCRGELCHPRRYCWQCS